MRLRLVKKNPTFDFFKRETLWLIASGSLMVLALVASLLLGMNFGIDFKGGTTIRTESAQVVDVGAYRDAISPLGLGDVSITEVFDPTFDENQNVAMLRVESQANAEAADAAMVESIFNALQTVSADIKFVSVESVGPKVSGELIQSAAMAVCLAIAAVLFYIWLRFEWQFAVGAVAALIHDVMLTIGVFAVLQIKFDLAIIAALLTIVGYSLNDTVVVFDRVRENLRKYKKLAIADVLNMSINETLARTVMTSVTTLLALISLYVLGGDVIRGFVFAMIWGVIVGTYSSIFIASGMLLRLGVKRDWSKQDASAGTQFGNKDA